MKAQYILARFSAVQKTWENSYTLEIYHDGPATYTVAEVHIVYSIIALARLMNCPVKLWIHNPSEVNRAIREYAREYGVIILED